jgi:hypothetical protein
MRMPQLGIAGAAVLSSLTMRLKRRFLKWEMDDNHRRFRERAKLRLRITYIQSLTTPMIKPIVPLTKPKR